VIVASSHVAELTEATVDAVAARLVLEKAGELWDTVARAEIRHRAALLQATLTDRIERAFDVGRRGVTCFAGGDAVRIANDRDFSELLSVLCDRSYHRSPTIRNEMLNRRELTSQGAKTRRELLELMFSAEETARLGIDGFGPDRAMYESVLAASGIHQERDGKLRFGPPRENSGLASAWEAIAEVLDLATDRPIRVDELYRHLMAPPFGIKEGPVPVLLAAALIHRADDVFVFEDGSFLPTLGPEHFERLVKTPERFSLKRASMLGVRAGLFRELQRLIGADVDRLPAKVRNTTTLAVVRPLIMLLHSLPEYSRRTQLVSEVARRVRDALATTIEPDGLLFAALPRACGILELTKSNSATYVATLKGALDELAGSYDLLLERLAVTLRAAFDTRGPDRALREELRSRARHLVEHVIDRRLRSFLLIAANEELEDREWLEAVATVLAQKPPASWSDSDIAVFESAALEVSRPFRRLELLHLQMATTQQDGFTARRVTVTQPDGTELSKLVWLEESRADALMQVLNDAVASAARIGGADACDGLLALLAERVLENQAPDSTVSDTETRKKAGIA
jgi:hypothetical protein